MNVITLAALLATAGFDCERASTFVEDAICRTPAIAALDRGMNTIYRRQPQTSKLQKGQREWLSERDACKDVACVTAAYEARLRDFGLPGYWGPQLSRPDYSGFLYLVDAGAGWKVFRIEATWGADRAFGPNIGAAAGAFQVIKGKGQWRDAEGCILTFDRAGSTWSVRESKDCRWGANVSMTGVYR